MRDAREPRRRTRPVPGPRRARIRLGVKELLAAGFATGTAVVLAMGAAGGTYAYLNDTATLGGGTVTAGSAALTVSGSPIALGGLYPTATRYAAVTVTNTGSVPLQLRVEALAGPAAPTAFSSSLTIGVGIATSAANCTNGSTPSVWTGTLAAAPSGGLGATLAAGASTTVCVATTMSAAAPAGAQSSSTGYTLTLGGRQS